MNSYKLTGRESRSLLKVEKNTKSSLVRYLEHLLVSAPSYRLSPWCSYISSSNILSLPCQWGDVFSLSTSP